MCLICCQSHQMPSFTHSLIWYFVWETGAGTVGVCFIWTSVGYHEETCWGEWPRQWHRCFRRES